MSINFTIIVGKIISKPQQSIINKNTSFIKSTIQIAKIRKKKNSFDKIFISIWGPLANDLIKYYKIGDYAIFQGHLNQDSFEGKKSLCLNVSKIYPLLLKSKSNKVIK